MVVLDAHIDRSAVVADLANENIESTIGTYACHQHDAYASFLTSAPLPNSDRFGNKALTLPLVPSMTSVEIERVVTGLTTSIARLSTQQQAA